MMLIGNGDKAEAAWSVVSVAFGAFESLEKRARIFMQTLPVNTRMKLPLKPARREMGRPSRPKMCSRRKLWMTAKSRECGFGWTGRMPGSPAAAREVAPVEIVEQAEAEVEEPTMAPEVAAATMSEERCHAGAGTSGSGKRRERDQPV